ncbi:AraC family transcriptional regulator [Agromyces sp. Soil535]|uniref:AraC family transcriptional regulator n=1 Tax=Agromyces sp. Soil535 TaxID=1736390 RepID=UPI0006F55026|nr:AraC family transcriptional regulator [Agromyces sp. Soil535]KRE22482.1 hypothetical protein ASG80_11305 [Agromyces sp. Soil535]
MDALSEVLARARARGAVFSVLGRNTPWGLDFSGGRPLVIHVLQRGSAVLTRANGSHRVGEGDVVLVRGGTPYSLASAPGATSEPIELARARGSHATGDDDAVVLCGAYTIGGSPGADLLDSLPDVLVVAAGEQSAGLGLLVGLLAAEADRAAPGQQAVLDRALDLVLVQALRDAFTIGTWEAPGWYRALGDPALAAVLDVVHSSPEDRWTVESMARLAHLSRAGFARRFAATVGETPAAYVTRLRIERAEDLLRGTTDTVAAVAAITGFASEYSLAAAFKRRHRISPGRWRRQVRSA